MENQFWAVGCGLGWTVGKKGLGQLWATFEACFFTFSGSKKNLKFFWKHYSVRTEKLHNTSFTKKKFFSYFEPEKVKKPGFFRAKIWVEFECKYIKVGTRPLFFSLVFTHENLKERASKFAHNRPKPFFTVQPSPQPKIFFSYYKYLSPYLWGAEWVKISMLPPL